MSCLVDYVNLQLGVDCSSYAEYKTVSRNKSFRKSVHLFLQFMAFFLSLVGLWAAWKFHNDKGIDNFYSLHSCGLLVCNFLSIQVVPNSRATLLPWHVFFGIYIYALAIATCATGFLEKATFLQASHIISPSPPALLVNCLGVLIVVLGGLVILAVVSPMNGRGDIIRGPAE
ncbi:hypothetical protein HAX54_037116 [Datura stramonium]|uniref:Cytochrome b561 domain-containing protein n=1 Tax=Datura stramonium TaxID=4076 RepID=A0ABS8VLT7_DATST|nr:hypothetical protein [Datura stramonium]